MRKFIKVITIFVLGLAIFDWSFGKFFIFLRSHTRGGDIYKENYIANKCIADVLILGSSRAARHYDPNVLKDSLGLSCYNCGEPGCGSIVAYTRYKMVSERHYPKLVIYDLHPLFDYLDINDYSRQIGILKPYANFKAVRDNYDIFGDKLDKISLLSSMYRNNSQLIDCLQGVFDSDKLMNGFQPLLGIMSERNANKYNKMNYHPIDSLKLEYLEDFFRTIRNDNVPLIVIVSPFYKNSTNIINYRDAVNLCNRLNIPFIDNTEMSGIYDDRLLFRDYQHLNVDGARLYTQRIISQIKGYLKN
jgi:hypothetical protein